METVAEKCDCVSKIGHDWSRLMTSCLESSHEIDFGTNNSLKLCFVTNDSLKLCFGTKDSLKLSSVHVWRNETVICPKSRFETVFCPLLLSLYECVVLCVVSGGLTSRRFLRGKPKSHYLHIMPAADPFFETTSNYYPNSTKQLKFSTYKPNHKNQAHHHLNHKKIGCSLDGGVNIHVVIEKYWFAVNFWSLNF